MFTQGKTNTSKERRRMWLFTAVLVAVATSGCAGVPFKGKVLVQPSPVLRLSWATARRTDRSILVLGQVQQVHCCALRVPGHIHLKAISVSGATVAATDAVWGEFIARQLHSASFKALLPVASTTSVAVIDIEFNSP